MSRKEFIRQNRVEIDEVIRRECPNIRYLNDEVRWEWVRNWETLYRWAKSEGVKVDQ